MATKPVALHKNMKHILILTLTMAWKQPFDVKICHCFGRYNGCSTQPTADGGCAPHFQAFFPGQSPRQAGFGLFPLPKLIHARPSAMLRKRKLLGFTSPSPSPRSTERPSPPASYRRDSVPAFSRPAPQT